MDKLPPELLFKIMMFLPPMDRLSCSLTCRRLAEAMTSAQLLDDVWLDIARHEMETASSVLVHTQRQYTKLSLHKADLRKFDSDFWGKVGANLRVLELRYGSWSNHTFYAILRQCTNLESLILVNESFEEMSIDDFAQPEDAFCEELRDSLSHLRHLHLDSSTTAEMVDLLLGLMPNVTSIFLTPLLWKSEFSERLPPILEKNGIVRMGVDLNDKNCDDTDHYSLINFVRMTSGSLEDFQIYDIELSERECDAIVECTGLRRLTIHNPNQSFRASHIRKLVSNSPDLEILELMYVEPLEDEDRMPLFELKKLHTLYLEGPYPGTGTTTEFLRRLGEISSLVKLVLDRFDVDKRVLQSLGRLTNLRSLTIVQGTDSECFEAICENFENRLTELDLGCLQGVTDADGMKLSRFKELRSLSFFNGHGLTDVTFERGVGSRTMKSLRIDGCSLTDAGLMSIASHHDRLEYMILHDCKNVTDAGILAFLRNEPRLKTLYLNVSSLRTDLRNICPRLRSCNVVPGPNDSGSWD